MFDKILIIIDHCKRYNISPGRKEVLEGFARYIAESLQSKAVVPLIFICTHNSRRSHFSQIWAQVMATNFGFPQIQCYSGGTEVTAMYPTVAKTLEKQGFHKLKLSEGSNPVYALKYDLTSPPIICFSKEYTSSFNPTKGFAAVLTCSHADEGCPVVIGAEARFSIPYEDPKRYDQTSEEEAEYRNKSEEIAAEMWWVFHRVAEITSNSMK